MFHFLDAIAYRGNDKIFYLITCALALAFVAMWLVPASRQIASWIWRQRSGRIGLCLLGAHLFIAVVLPWLISQDPFTQHDLADYDRYSPPTADFLLGTDDRNRDFLARITSGGRAAIAVTSVTALLAVAWGSLAGIFLTLLPGWVDTWVMRVVDAMISIPWIAFLLLAIALFGGSGAGGFAFVPILGFFYGLAVLRVVRAHSRTIVALDFVSAARARGHSTGWIAFHEVMPNCRDVILVEFAMRWTWLLLAFSSAAFFGLMIQIPTPDWSSMIAGSRSLFLSYPNIFWPPVILLSTLILGINFTADGLAKALGLDRSAADVM